MSGLCTLAGRGGQPQGIVVRPAELEAGQARTRVSQTEIQASTLPLRATGQPIVLGTVPEQKRSVLGTRLELASISLAF